MEAIKKVETLENAVNECIKLAKGNRKKASELLVERIQDNFELYREIVEPAIPKLAWQAIRKKIPHEKKETTKQDPQTIGLYAVSARNWLEHVLPSGIPLREANVEAIINASETHARASRQHMTESRWLKRIAETLPPGKTVGEVFTHESLNKLRIQIA